MGEFPVQEKVKGYKEKVQFQPVAEIEKKTKREAVARVIVEALRRLKKREKGKSNKQKSRWKIEKQP